VATYKRPKDAYDLMRRLDGVDLSLECRSVLMAQYHYGDKDGTHSRASEDTIAAYLHTHVRTLRRHRKTLLAAGWLVERQRGRNTGGAPRASTYEIVIPTHQEAPSQRAPKKTPTNPSGRNQWSKPSSGGQICPPAQEDTSRHFPSAQEDKSGHLPKGPKIDVGNTSNHRPPEQEDPWGATPAQPQATAAKGSDIDGFGLQDLGAPLVTKYHAVPDAELRRTCSTADAVGLHSAELSRA
jgi:hypothetical protein